MLPGCCVDGYVSVGEMPEVDSGKPSYPYITEESGLLYLQRDVLDRGMLTSVLPALRLDPEDQPFGEFAVGLLMVG